MTTVSTTPGSVNRQAGAEILIPEEGRIRRSILGTLDVSEVGLNAAADYISHSGMVSECSPRWEVLEFLQDILARMRLPAANPDESPRDNR